MDTHLPVQWIDRLCGIMLIPLCPAVRQLFEAWARAEGGTARWNPLNTTLPMPGAWLYNSAGVRNYPFPVSGIAATAATLALPYYRQLWGSLQVAHANGHSARQIVEANRQAFDTWGTGADHVLAALT